MCGKDEGNTTKCRECLRVREMPFWVAFFLLLTASPLSFYAFIALYSILFFLRFAALGDTGVPLTGRHELSCYTFKNAALTGRMIVVLILHLITMTHELIYFFILTYSLRLVSKGQRSTDKNRWMLYRTVQ